MHLSSLSLTHFRNYSDLALELPEEGAVFRGANGAGKTNLLEAIHVLCTGRSQRDADRQDMVCFGADACCVEGNFLQSGGTAETSASIGFSRDRKTSMSRDGRRVMSLSAWFGHGLVVSFGPDDLNLVYGPPRQRRKFLDIVASQMCPTYLERLISYRRNLLSRNRLLALGVDDQQLDIYESQLAGDGAFLILKRQEIVASLSPFLHQFYGEISQERERSAVVLQPSFSADFDSETGCRNVFLEVLERSRKKDMKLGFTSVGPHRDDLKITLNNQPAKAFGSQGQCRSLALALRLSTVLSTEKYRQEKMVFLVDDAFSELDDERVRRTYPLLEGRGQVLLTTPGQVRFGEDRVLYTVAEGSIAPA